jgi:hypothetical protein
LDLRCKKIISQKKIKARPIASEKRRATTMPTRALSAAGDANALAAGSLVLVPCGARIVRVGFAIFFASLAISSILDKK